jgi:predicted PurR-regulated permease PerM
LARSHKSAIALALLTAMLLYVGWYLRKALLLIYFAMVVAMLLLPFVDRVARVRIRRWRAGRAVGVIVLAIGLAGVVALFVFVMLPPILHDARSMVTQLPQMLADFKKDHPNLPFVNKLHPATLTEHLDRIVGGAQGLMARMAEGAAAFVSMVILAAYFMIDGEQALRWVLSMFATATRIRLRRTLQAGVDRMRGWLSGQLILMLIHGVSATIAFGILHIKFFYVLGVFAGVINIIPVVGPVLTMIVAGLVAATQSLMKTVGVVIFFLIYHNAENIFLVPRIMSNEVELPGVAVIAALLIGEELAGLPGMLLAIPTAALVAELVNEYLLAPCAEQQGLRRTA